MQMALILFYIDLTFLELTLNKEWIYCCYNAHTAAVQLSYSVFLPNKFCDYKKKDIVLNFQIGNLLFL